MKHGGEYHYRNSVFDLPQGEAKRLVEAGAVDHVKRGKLKDLPANRVSVTKPGGIQVQVMEEENGGTEKEEHQEDGTEDAN